MLAPLSGIGCLQIRCRARYMACRRFQAAITLNESKKVCIAAGISNSHIVSFSGLATDGSLRLFLPLLPTYSSNRCFASCLFPSRVYLFRRKQLWLQVLCPLISSAPPRVSCLQLRLCRCTASRLFAPPHVSLLHCKQLQLQVLCLLSLALRRTSLFSIANKPIL